MRIESFLQQSPVVQASRRARKMEASLNAILEGEGLTGMESLMLVAIFFEKPAECKPSELAEAFETTRGNVSHCVSSLEAKGVVKRRIDAEDARAVRLALTAEGRKRAVRVAGILDRMQRQFEAEVGVERLGAARETMVRVEELCAGMAGKARRG